MIAQSTAAPLNPPNGTVDVSEHSCQRLENLGSKSSFCSIVLLVDPRRFRGVSDDEW